MRNKDTNNNTGCAFVQLEPVLDESDRILPWQWRIVSFGRS